MPHVPKLCRHKHWARPYSTDPVTGRPVYFRPARSWPPPPKKPSKEIQEKYKAWLGQVLTRAVEVPGNPDPAGILVTEMLVSFWQWSKDYYRRPDGTVTSEPANVKHAV